MEWPFDGVFTLPIDWSTLQRVIFPTFGADAASKIVLLTERGFFAISLFKLRRSFWYIFFKCDFSSVFLAVFPEKKNNFSTHYFGNFDGSSSVLKQGIYSGTVRIVWACCFTHSCWKQSALSCLHNRIGRLPPH